ncbi:MULTISPECIES: MarR family winged helix-turn-helix transcriptional regulator [unclassified Janthinobacterium]|uniref:MarR family winged helix-turn-helix transcriptional regulator n=1 Tax=unclassified Janthinobacterium TaxID=2610881 RepID=UPI001615CC56|nr:MULTISPECIES: MarR family transcriptional regulator [unclassified Janthinobacterium]MBB5367110.1 DNA-binding MarR family transcriptional regulator [Janthinobacterium sp. K2C7]MBB5380412.1 DNA-binding MarR family transcriptional regulator [Janthinobacterium sp. K2Li3]MBB5385492.1 DNA-binding MarR family transcriptional regulator [Janthinobacterium sp. K2E3]
MKNLPIRLESRETEFVASKLISQAARALARLSDARLKGLGLAIGQLPVFVALKDGAQLSQKELARIAGVEQPSMAQLLARMERDGLIHREPDPADGRSSLISLSESATALLAPAREILFQGNREALAGFEPAEIDQLVSLLGRVIANVMSGEAA